MSFLFLSTSSSRRFSFSTCWHKKDCVNPTCPNHVQWFITANFMNFTNWNSEMKSVKLLALLQRLRVACFSPLRLAAAVRNSPVWRCRHNKTLNRQLNRLQMTVTKFYRESLCNFLLDLLWRAGLKQHASMQPPETANAQTVLAIQCPAMVGFHACVIAWLGNIFEDL